MEEKISRGDSREAGVTVILNHSGIKILVQRNFPYYNDIMSGTQRDPK
jgi:hypothetical protein